MAFDMPCVIKLYKEVRLIGELIGERVHYRLLDSKEIISWEDGLTIENDSDEALIKLFDFPIGAPTHRFAAGGRWERNDAENCVQTKIGDTGGQAKLLKVYLQRVVTGLAAMGSTPVADELPDELPIKAGPLIKLPGGEDD